MNRALRLRQKEIPVHLTRMLLAAGMVAMPSAAHAADFCGFLNQAVALVKADPTGKSLFEAGIAPPGYRVVLDPEPGGKPHYYRSVPKGTGEAERNRAGSQVEQCMKPTAKSFYVMLWYTVSTSPTIKVIVDYTPAGPRAYLDKSKDEVVLGFYYNGDS